jgi:hypothetical protein
MFAASLRQIEPADDAEPRRERLEQHRHQIRDQNDGKECVTERRTTGDVRRPVAGIHIADRDEVSGAGERRQFAPELPDTRRDADRAIRLRQARSGGARFGIDEAETCRCSD